MRISPVLISEVWIIEDLVLSSFITDTKREKIALPRKQGSNPDLSISRSLCQSYHSKGLEFQLSVSKILFLKRENNLHIFKPPCNFLFIILFSLYRQTNSFHKQEMTSSISLLARRMWKIWHLGPGCSFVLILKVVFSPVKHSCLYNNYNNYIFLLIF